MEAQKKCFSCHSCNRKMEYPSGEPPCEVLKGWLTVSHWKGSGSVKHHNFCSLSCLQQWLDAQLPQIPEVFIKCFKKDDT